MTALTDQAIGVVVSRRVPIANVEAFETALADLKQISSKHTGQIACDVLPRTVSRSDREYFISYRCADDRRLRARPSSPDRRLFVDVIHSLPVGGRRRELTGL